MKILAVITAAALSFATYSQASSILIGVDSISDELVQIDTSTGHATKIVQLSTRSVTGLTYDPISRTIFGYESDPSGSFDLLKINPISGDVETLFQPSTTQIAALAYDANSDVLYGARGLSPAQLLTFDKATGAFTFVGNLSTPAIVGMAFDSSTNTLYGFDDQSRSLGIIDQQTAAISFLPPANVEVFSLAYDAYTDTLFGIDLRTDQLVTFDRTTGAATFIGGEGLNGVRSLAVVPASILPEPSSIMLISLMTGVAASYRRGRIA